MQDDVAECIKKDYVAVVGTSAYFAFWSGQTARAAVNNVSGLDDIFSGGIMGPGSGDVYVRRGIKKMDRNADYANKMMFAGQAVRGLRRNSAGADYKTLIYFKSGYTAEQIAAIKTAASTYATAGRVFGINSTDELIAKLNAPNFPGDSCSRRILRMDIYAHGKPGYIAFDYEGELGSALNFGPQRARKLDRTRYDLHGSPSRIYSWACRTAISDSGKHGGFAQVLADATGATVYAYSRRSHYVNTWNTGSVSAKKAGLTEIVSPGSRVLWHPDGALGGVTEAPSPAENPSGMFAFKPKDSD
ncbi:MAG: hypothetical protein ACRCS3_04325 [Paracoccaceae bacterium]